MVTNELRISNFIFFALLLLSQISHIINMKIRRDNTNNIINISQKTSKLNEISIQKINNTQSNFSKFREIKRKFQNYLKQKDTLFLVKKIKEKYKEIKTYTEKNIFEKLKDYFQSEPSKYLKHQKEFPKGEICSKENCLDQNGTCLTLKICKCNFGYADLIYSAKTCNYKQRFQKLALLSEFIVPIGLGHFYSSRNLVGSIKFAVLFLIPIIFLFLSKILPKMNEKEIYVELFVEEKYRISNMWKKVLSTIYIFVFSIWFLFDITMFAANIYKDGWGYDLIKI